VSRVGDRSSQSGRYGWDRGLTKPFSEADLAEPGAGTRHQHPLAQFGAEVAGVPMITIFIVSPVSE
jgi:hypothetical protein